MRKRNSLEQGLVPAPPRFHPRYINNAQPSFDRHDGEECLSRVPYSSLMAFVLCIIGVVLFSIMMVWSFNASVEQTRRALNITDIPWLDKVQLLFIVTALVMAGTSISLLCIGILSTGSTREEVYKLKSARQGGRLACVVAIVFSYLLNIVWMVVLALTAILTFVYFIFGELCSALKAYTESDCLDLSILKPLVKDVSDANLMMCGGNVQQFCALSSTVFIWYLVGFVGSVFVCLGLIQFIASNAANYAHISHEKQRAELKDVLEELGGGGGGVGIYSSTSDGNLAAVAGKSYGRGEGTFQVDYHPQYQQSVPKKTYPLPPPTLTPQQQFHLATQASGQQGGTWRSGQPMGGGHMPMRPVNARRNSYHDSLNGNSGWMNTLY